MAQLIAWGLLMMTVHLPVASPTPHTPARRSSAVVVPIPHTPPLLPSGARPTDEHAWSPVQQQHHPGSTKSVQCHAEAVLDKLPVITQTPDTRLECRVPFHGNTEAAQNAMNASVLLAIGAHATGADETGPVGPVCPLWPGHAADTGWKVVVSHK